MIAAKFFDDVFYNNSFYGQVGNIPMYEINRMEIEFLRMISFDMLIDNGVFVKYLKHLLLFRQ